MISETFDAGVRIALPAHRLTGIVRRKRSGRDEATNACARIIAGRLRKRFSRLSATLRRCVGAPASP